MLRWVGCQLKSFRIVPQVHKSHSLLEALVASFKFVLYLKTLFLSSLRFMAKLSGRHRFPVHPHPALSTPHHSSALVILSEPILTRHHPESTLTAGFGVSPLHSVGLDKLVMTCIHYHTGYFHCPKNPLCSACPPPLPRRGPRESK